MLKFIRSLIVGLVIFFGTFSLAVVVSNSFYNQDLQEQAHNVSLGMTTSEVVNLLGKPSDIKMSDIPGSYWSYDKKQFLGRPIPFLFFEVSRDGHVVKVISPN